MTYKLNHLQSHPLAVKFYELSLEIEKLPADVRQTGLLNDLHRLRDNTEHFLNNPPAHSVTE